MRIGDESCAAEVLLFQRVRNAGRLKDMVTSNQLDAAIFNAQLVRIVLYMELDLGLLSY